MDSLIDWFITLLVHWFLGSFIHWFINSLIHWFVNCFIETFTHLFINLFLAMSRSFCQFYDMQEHSTKVFHDLVNSLASFIQSLYSGAGQQTSASSTPPHSPSSPLTPTSHQSPANTGSNSGSLPTPGFHYHGVWLPLVKLPAGQAKPVL